MKINEVAKLTGVTVRTLHYYDQIGLLVPEETTEAGYRIYKETDLLRLQQILLYRELDFPLQEIKKILETEDYDQTEALIRQRNLLQCKCDRIKKIIHLIDQKIGGEKKMSFEEFNTKEFDEMRTKYAAEVKERWGKTKEYEESEGKIEKMSQKEKNMMGAGADNIFREFAAQRENKPESTAVQALVKKWQDYITDNMYTCTKEILAGLGQMYTGDERFQNYLDSFGTGTAQLMSDAIAIYCK